MCASTLDMRFGARYMHFGALDMSALRANMGDIAPMPRRAYGVRQHISNAPTYIEDPEGGYIEAPLGPFSYESIVEIVNVVSSSTSSRTRTVSREVMMVTLFSVA